MTKKKSPEELTEAKREAAERRAFAKGKVAGNGVKTGKAKAKAEKPKAAKTSKPKAKAPGATNPKAPTGRVMAGKAQPALNEAIAKAREDLLNPNGKGDTSVSHGFSGEPLKHIAGPAPKDIESTIAPPTGVHEWRQPRAASVAAHIESTFHRRHLTERAVVEAEAEEALSDARLALSKVHGETTKPPQPRCEIEYRSKVYGEVSRVTQDLDVRLTRDEQLETAESCAHYVASRARMRDLKKSVDSTLGALTKNYDDLVTIYSRAVETGVLSVPVTTIDILEAGEVRTIRADDGRIIKKRQATKEEMQVPIFGESDFGDDSHTEAAQ